MECTPTMEQQTDENTKLKRKSSESPGDELDAYKCQGTSPPNPPLVDIAAVQMVIAALAQGVLQLAQEQRIVPKADDVE